jgi:peptidyl-prolyl cis-trans isomerase SurA
MRYLRISLAVTGILSIFGTQLQSADVTVIEEIVCKVNGDIITRSELERDRKDAENQLRQSGLTGRALQESLNSEAKNILGGRIDTLLLIQKGKEMDLKVDGELTKQIANVQRQTGIADPVAFQEFVREKTGQPFEDYKKDMKDQILKNRVIRQEISGGMKVKREELEKYYNEHKDDFQRKEQIYLRVIFISTEGKDAVGIAAADRKARDVSRRGKAGEKFTELAQSNSDGPSAANGGDMPPFQKDEMRKDIVDAVWEKDRGFVTDPIRTPNGFEIYKVEEHQKAGLAEFEEVLGQVEDQVLRPRMGGAYRDYLTKLRKDAFLEIKAGYQDSFAAPGKNTAWSDPAQLTPQTVTKQQVAAQTHHKKLLWAIPIPGTTAKSTGTSSSH